ncbi:MAG: GTPase ObgE [bacterium]
MFIDIVKIRVESGKGGAGCVSCRREKFVPRGGPDGGNGGAGGSVWIVANDNSSTLLDFRYRRRYQAGNGNPGQGKCKSGAMGDDLEIPVPCGTSIYDVETDRLLGDLIEAGERLLVARGGKGGKGNHEFRTARNQTPMYAQPGIPGQRLELRLELKLIADIGLIGAPNAGKSTLLSVISAARPKIADYPFTTLVPNLGIVDLGEYQSCSVADIPGLIEGASLGKGLGLEFLRHVERTRALLYLVDLSTGPPRETLNALRQELVEYGHRLPDLDFGVVLTKQDLVTPDETAAALSETETWAAENGAQAVIVISAVAQMGLDSLRHLLRRLFTEAPGRSDD